MSYYAGKYDVAVIGAGHAGCEAGLASARLGMKTLIFSISLECIANMPCNPHIGGSSKGHIVREIDCLGGEMGKNIDKSFLQMKMLKPKFIILDELDSGLDVDAMRIVADGVNMLHTDKTSTIVITHYERLLDMIKPSVIHVLWNGRIVKTAGPELAKEIEVRGYDWIKAEAK